MEWNASLMRDTTTAATASRLAAARTSSTTCRQDPVAIVALTKKPAVERCHPSIAIPVHHGGESRERAIGPAARADDVDERPLGMDHQIDDQPRHERGHEREERAPGECILKTLPNEDPDVEQPLRDDGIGKGARQRNDHQSGDHEASDPPTRRTDLNQRPRFVMTMSATKKQTDAGGRNADQEHTYAASLVHVGRPAIIRDEHRDADCIVRRDANVGPTMANQ